MPGERERKKRREENRGAERGEGRRGWGKTEMFTGACEFVHTHTHTGSLRKATEEERGVTETKRSHGEAVSENGYPIN